MSNPKCSDCSVEVSWSLYFPRCRECYIKWTTQKNQLVNSDLVYCKECDSMVQHRCFEGPYGEYQGMPLYSCGKIEPGVIKLINGAQIELSGGGPVSEGSNRLDSYLVGLVGNEPEQDHWTFPEDPETKAGWWIFNFDWLMKPYKEAVEWHDRVTTKGSYAQQIGITNERINVNWRDMLEHMYKTTPKAGFIKRLGWFAGFFVSKINRFFYEGKLR